MNPKTGVEQSAGARTGATSAPGMSARPPAEVSARRLALGVYCLICAAAMLVIGGSDFTRLYAPWPHHRLQADALLRGQLHLADSVCRIGHDLAWHDGQAHQVWGLGAGLWLLPFEALWRALGMKWFPDRIALGIAFALLAWYAGTAAWRLAGRARSPALGIALVWLVTLCPALWALNRGGRLIYEETSLYACLVSLGIMVAVARVACFGERKDFLICAALAAMSALTRPTHGSYGLAAMLVCTCLLLARGWSVKTLVAGHAVFVAGLVVLALTNASRFGSVFEFGHRLTVTPGIIVFTTRMDNPMRDAGWFEAARELCGWLFLTRDIQPRGPDDIAVPGQAPFLRWRDPSMTTFSPAWAVIAAAALLGSGMLLNRARRGGREGWLSLRRPGRAMIVALAAWGALSAFALACFYLRFPGMSARYLLDFAPAFTALALVFWFALLRRTGWLSRQRVPGILPLFALGGWLGYEILTTRIGPPPMPPLSRAEIQTELPQAEGRRLVEFGGGYSLENHPSQTGIAYNGYGWPPENGMGRNIVILALDRPEFIELVTGPRQPGVGTLPARPDFYRAMMDGRFLALREAREEGGLIRVRFDVPESIRKRAGEELLFLCFSKGYDREDRASLRPLHSVRWRRGKAGGFGAGAASAR